MWAVCGLAVVNVCYYNRTRFRFIGSKSIWWVGEHRVKFSSSAERLSLIMGCATESLCWSKLQQVNIFSARGGATWAEPICRGRKMSCGFGAAQRSWFSSMRSRSDWPPRRHRQWWHVDFCGRGDPPATGWINPVDAWVCASASRTAPIFWSRSGTRRWAL